MMVSPAPQPLVGRGFGFQGTMGNTSTLSVASHALSNTDASSSSRVLINVDNRVIISHGNVIKDLADQPSFILRTTSL